eukprot:TRINITY_DN1503_c0_g1_i1.p1 TRINITY_DN1503_c0_g1~~TRINITY_DN1503_c0_g1_i1.p1  ORF type:complete len:758 (-),score=129.08 TRINITY_DN1503_c0_g1_i1:439-2712(-)
MMLAKRAPHTCFRFSTTLQYQHIKLATPHKASIKPDIPQFHGDQTQLITTLGLCAGQLVLSGMAEASPAIAVEGQQGISLPLLLLGGLLLVAGAMNGVFTVMKTAIEKQSQQQLLDKALTRHNNFVNGVDNLDVTNEEVITEQEEQQQDISSTQMGTGKSGIQIQSTEQAELESVQEGGQVLAVAASSAEMVQISNQDTLSSNIEEQYVSTVLFTEARNLSAQPLFSNFQTGVGKSGVCNRNGKFVSKGEGNVGRAYLVATSPSELVQYSNQDTSSSINQAQDITIYTISEDRSLSAHSINSNFQTGIGKGGVCGRNGQVAQGILDVGRAYSTTTPLSEPVQYTSQDTIQPQEYIPYTITEVRSLSAHSLRTTFQSGLGKSGYSSWSGQYKFKPIIKVGHGYWLSSTPSESLQFVNKESIQSPQVLIPEDRTLSAHSLTSTFQTGVGKTGVCDRSGQPIAEGETNIGRAFAVATPPSEPVQYSNQVSSQDSSTPSQSQEYVPYSISEVRSLSAHSLLASFQTGLGKTGYSSWSGKYKFKPVLKTGHGYWLSTTPTEYSKEDLTQNEIDSKQVGFSNLVGKVGESSWTQTLKSEEAAEKVTPYESATEASEPVSLETHYQYITSRTQPSDAVEQQAQKEEVVEKVVEDRSEAGEVMKSEFEKSLGRVGSAGFSEKQVTEEAVTRAQLELVETEVSHPVSQHIVEEVEEEAKEEEEEVTPQLSKNPLVRLIQAILNFFKWLWNLLFGGGSSSGSKPAAA